MRLRRPRLCEPRLLWLRLRRRRQLRKACCCCGELRNARQIRFRLQCSFDTYVESSSETATGLSNEALKLKAKSKAPNRSLAILETCWQPTDSRSPTQIDHWLDDSTATAIRAISQRHYGTADEYILVHSFSEKKVVWRAPSLRFRRRNSDDASAQGSALLRHDAPHPSKTLTESSGENYHSNFHRYQLATTFSPSL